jgi:DNA-binding transcriptional LysR family regulator
MSTFVEVANTGSFSAAAKHLRISRTSVTTNVQSLEQQLGIRLLNRTTRKVSLTEEGEVFYRRFNQIVSQIAEVEELASTLLAKPNGRLRLNTDIGLARIMAPLVGDYLAQFPAVSVDLIMTDHMADMVQDKFDLAILAAPLASTDLVSRRLGSGRLVVCAAPAYVDRRGMPIHPQDLTNHNCLCFLNGSAVDRWHFADESGTHVVDAAGNMRSNSIEALRAGTLAGHGISFLPRFSVADDLKEGRLVRLLAEYEPPDAAIHAAYPSGRHLSLKVRTFLDFVVRHLSDTGLIASRASAVKTTAGAGDAA